MYFKKLIIALLFLLWLSSCAEQIDRDSIDWLEQKAEQYSYKRSYLTISRLEDGTSWDW